MISLAILSNRVPKAEHAYVKHGPTVYKFAAERMMEEVDAMPAEWRALVHEYGITKVRQARRAGWSAKDTPAKLAREYAERLRRLQEKQMLEELDL